MRRYRVLATIIIPCSMATAVSDDPGSGHHGSPPPRGVPPRVQLAHGADGEPPPAIGVGQPLPEIPKARPKMDSISGDANMQLGMPELAARLKKLYKEKLLPMERMSLYSDFYGSFLTDSHFDSKPMVLLIGPYSVGKTSFIRYLLGRGFPGERIGPEPTTDRFIVVMGGTEDRVTPGNALAANADTPFQPLSMFGTQFLNKLEASQLNAPILQRLTLVDTPGVLSGEKQREMRGYDVYKVRSAPPREHGDPVPELMDLPLGGAR